MNELEISHTGVNLKNDIAKTLAKFDISMEQVYSFTTDNGANMVIAVKIFGESVVENLNNTNNQEV